MNASITYQRGDRVEYQHIASGAWRPALVEAVRASDNAMVLQLADGGTDAAPMSSVRPRRPEPAVTISQDYCPRCHRLIAQRPDGTFYPHGPRASRCAAPSHAEVMARVMGARGVTIVEERRELDGTLTEISRETWGDVS